MLYVPREMNKLLRTQLGDDRIELGWCSKVDAMPTNARNVHRRAPTVQRVHNVLSARELSQDGNTDEAAPASDKHRAQGPATLLLGR